MNLEESEFFKNHINLRKDFLAHLLDAIKEGVCYPNSDEEDCNPYFDEFISLNEVIKVLIQWGIFPFK